MKEPKPELGTSRASQYTQEALGKRNATPNDGILNNAAVVNKIGSEFSGGCF